MSFFKLKQPIQLQQESSSSVWSFSCCSHLFNRKGAIQLPESDIDQVEESPNIFIVHQRNSLSHNPFARSSNNIEQSNSAVVTQETQDPYQEPEEELIDFSQHKHAATDHVHDQASLSDENLIPTDEDTDKIPKIDLQLKETSLSIVPSIYSELPLMSTNVTPLQQPSTNQPDDQQTNKSQDLESIHQNDNSLVKTAAQSILGSKLEDVTEKLAFIKKNIIMNLEEEEEETVVSPIKENSNSFIKSNRRTSTLKDVAPTITRFMNQIGNSLDNNQESAHKYSPSSLFSVFAGPIPEQSNTKGIQEDQSEELFDFTKVIEMGKGVVGNGIRIFNDVATRVKTSVEQLEEEQQQKNNQRHVSMYDSSSSSSSGTNNDNEWMHNYL